MIKPQFASLSLNHTSHRREVSEFKSKINMQQLRRVQSINHKIISRKTQLLPEITSPFLKKTVHSLFFPKNNAQLSPIKRYDNDDKFIHTLTHQISNPNAVQNAKIKKIFNKNDAPCQIINLDDQELLSKKIGKSFSEVKKFSGGVEDIKGIRGLSPPKSIDRSKTIVKISTESSLDSEQSPKQIYQRLKELNEKGKVLNGEEKCKTKEREVSKETKKSIFAVKHKMTQQLYSDEREQIKQVKNLMNETNHMNLGRSLQIKNYTKFFPNIINIESL